MADLAGTSNQSGRHEEQPHNDAPRSDAPRSTDRYPQKRLKKKKANILRIIRSTPV